VSKAERWLVIGGWWLVKKPFFFTNHLFQFRNEIGSSPSANYFNWCTADADDATPKLMASPGPEGKCSPSG